MEQTQRGEKERDREKDAMEGEPAKLPRGDGETKDGDITRDKGVPPAKGGKQGQKKS